MTEVPKKKKRRSGSPTQRTLKLLRKQSWICHVVEKWVGPRGPGGKRIDAFGFGDILAMRPGSIALVQTFNASDLQRHIDKVKALATFQQWHAAGGLVIFVAWRKLKASNSFGYTWKPRVFTTGPMSGYEQRLISSLTRSAPNVRFEPGSSKNPQK
jgi:hypothetical protein